MTCGDCKSGSLPTNLLDETAKHPCYSFAAHREFARMHLPIAPLCNISCNYCNRKYDCVNESRPGVTSEVLTPAEAVQKAVWVKRELPHLSVIGIAGPGDTLANWPAVRETLQSIRQQDSEVIFCLSTNGLMLPDYADEILALGVRHVTVTVNCISPAIGAKIYRRIVFRGQVMSGEKGAAVLLARQQEGIARLVAGGAMVKVNIVMIPGINEEHIPEVVQCVRDLGAVMTNIMPLIPAPGSAFAHYPQTSRKDLEALRDRCADVLPQMRHCQQCRADAIGLLTDDQSQHFRLHAPKEAEAVQVRDGNYLIAVATRDGSRVDLHYGETNTFYIYQAQKGQITFLEKRQLPRYCNGPDDCQKQSFDRAENVRLLGDCEAVVSMRIGYGAKESLKKANIISVETCDDIESGIRTAIEVLQLPQVI